MENTLNKNIVFDTFNNAYNEQQFKIFVRDLFPTANFAKEQMIQPIPNDYKDFIRSAKRICKYSYSSPDYIDGHVIDILVVKLKRTTSIDRARTAQRNFVARYLNGSRDYQKDAALVVFIAEDENENISPDWRFSLIKMDYVTKIVEDKNGNKKRKTEQELTPAKRFSFLVGENEDTHTAQQQFAACLEKSAKGEKITVEDLVEAFDIEKVSKEFFDKYKALYIKLRDELNRLCEVNEIVKKDFTEHNINIDDFAKKTLGQLVFLYFIQKKGWLGVPRDKDWGLGDKKFLRNLFDKKYIDYDNFFNDILEHLFYEALASDRGIAAWFDKLNCRIPFLNGGLFEPINGYEYTKTDLTINNAVFKEIFDTFELYNFTVKEDEPLEKEVAIDPEMLGKVFENLLPENIQKGEGAFYTRREIVHYMCQESLINYLYNKINVKVLPISDEKQAEQQTIYKKDKQLNLTEEVTEEIISKEDIEFFIKTGNSTYIHKNKKLSVTLPDTVRDNAQILDNSLADIKVCDPAIGSGAFPVGMMNEIVRARAALNEFLGKPDRAVYELKRNTIENSIYGVDIDAGAVEIAKLRFWLSLVVDEEDIKNIKPLPNLDYKIMQGNSLITSYEDIDFDEIVSNQPKDNQLDLFASESYKITDRISHKQLEFLKTPYATKKGEIKQEIENLIVELVKTKFEEKAQKEGRAKDYYEDKLKNFAQNRENRNFFPWKLFFADAFEHGGFDVVIGNPPYLGEAKNGDNLKQLAGMKYYQGKMNIWYYFTCFGLDILKNNGILNFIAPNNWNTATGASIMRNKILEETKILCYKDFGNYHAFESADQQTMIFLLWKNDKQNSEYILNYSRISNDSINKEQLIQFLDKNLKSPYAETYETLINKTEMKDKLLTFVNYANEKLFVKIAKNKIFLNDDEISQGITPNPDTVGEKNIKKLSLETIRKYNIQKGEGVFVVPKNHFNDLTEIERAHIKPLFEPKEIDKYYIPNNPSSEIIYISKNNDFTNENSILLKHLFKYKEIMEKRRENQKGSLKYWHLHWAKEEDFFKAGAKILSVRKCSYPTFVYTENPTYVLLSMNVILTGRFNLKYLTALLNSTLVKFWLKYRGKMQGDNFQVDKEPLLNIPIYKPSQNEERLIISIVDKILAITQSEDYLSNSEKQSAVKEYEKQIDIMVYKLYDLTHEEVLTIDKDFTMTEQDYNKYKL